MRYTPTLMFGILSTMRQRRVSNISVRVNLLYHELFYFARKIARRPRAIIVVKITSVFKKCLVTINMINDILA